MELEGRLPPWLAPGQSPPATAATTTTATASTSTTTITTTTTTDSHWKALRAGHYQPPSPIGQCCHRTVAGRRVHLSV